VPPRHCRRRQARLRRFARAEALRASVRAPPRRDALSCLLLAKVVTRAAVHSSPEIVALVGSSSLSPFLSVSERISTAAISRSF
jgi:hypothetical protein